MNPAVYMYTRTYIVMTIKSEKNSSYVKKKGCIYAYMYDSINYISIFRFDVDHYYSHNLELKAYVFCVGGIIKPYQFNVMRVFYNIISIVFTFHSSPCLCSSLTTRTFGKSSYSYKKDLDA